MDGCCHLLVDATNPLSHRHQSGSLFLPTIPITISALSMRSALFSRSHPLALHFVCRSRRPETVAGRTTVGGDPFYLMEDFADEESGLECYMKHVDICNRGIERRSEFMPFVVEERTVGFIHPRFMQHLRLFPSVFVTDRHGKSWRDTDTVTLHDSLRTNEQRTDAVSGVLNILNERGMIPGWRNELYPVVEAFGMQPLFSLERAAAPYFGIKAYGVHMNGYVSDASNGMQMWVARRSKTKQSFADMLDHLVAGGQPVGISCKENLIKECSEEAGIPKFIAERAVAVGAVSYEDIDGDRFKRDVLFCYDLEVPPDFKPCNKDGEVESFNLVPMAQVKRILWRTRLYKPNCALVVIDFLFRHGYLRPEQSGYLQLLQALRKGECI